MAVIWLHESLTVKTIDIPGLPGEMQGLSWKRPALHCPLQPLHGQQLHLLELQQILPHPAPSALGNCLHPQSDCLESKNSARQRTGTAAAVPGDAAGRCGLKAARCRNPLALTNGASALGASGVLRGGDTSRGCTARAACRGAKALGHCHCAAKAQRGGCAAAHDVLEAALGLPGSCRCRPCIQERGIRTSTPDHMCTAAVLREGLSREMAVPLSVMSVKLLLGFWTARILVAMQS